MNFLLNNLKLLMQVGRFGIVGGLASMTHVVSAFLLHYQLGISPMIANGTGFLLAWLVAYVGHFSWTFEGKADRRISVVRFTLVSFCALALNQFIVWTTTDVLPYPFWVAIIAVVVIVPTLTFTISKFWTFRQVSSQA